jgi:molecular chaperone HscB
MIECPSCGRRQEPRLICSDCGTPLRAELDCFRALGLPRKLTIDLSGLERTYHDLSRRIHPDRFANQPVAVRTASLSATALLTRAYRTLRDPVSRGLYWLELNGEKLAENNKQVPPDLAELVFDVQEQLAELRAAPKQGGSAARGLAEEVAARRRMLEARWDELHRALDANFARWDELGNGGEASPLVVELKNVLSRIAYLRTLIRDVDRELENAKAA